MKTKKFTDSNGNPILVILINCKTDSIVRVSYVDLDGNDSLYNFEYSNDETGRNVASNFFKGLTEQSILACVDFLMRDNIRREQR